MLRGDQNGIISLSHTKEGDFIEVSIALFTTSSSSSSSVSCQVKLLDFGEMSPPPMQAGELEERKLRLDEWDRRDQVSFYCCTSNLWMVHDGEFRTLIRSWRRWIGLNPRCMLLGMPWVRVIITRVCMSLCRFG